MIYFILLLFSSGRLKVLGQPGEWAVETVKQGHVVSRGGVETDDMCWWVEDGADQAVAGGVVGRAMLYSRKDLFDRGGDAGGDAGADAGGDI